MIEVIVKGLDGDVWLNKEVDGGIFIFRNYQLKYSSVVERVAQSENSFCLLYLSCQKLLNILLDKNYTNRILTMEPTPIALLIIKENGQIIVEQEVDMFSLIGYSDNKLVNDYFGESIESDSFLYTTLARLNFAFYESLGKTSLITKHPGTCLRLSDDTIERIKKNFPEFLLENKTLITQYMSMLTTLISDTKLTKEI